MLREMLSWLRGEMEAAGMTAMVAIRLRMVCR